MAPSMNENMYLHFSTQRNLAFLQAQGVHIIEPEEGFLACKAQGKGRMAEPEKLFAAIDRQLHPATGQPARTALVTAGPTYEAVDAVRFIDNNCTGKLSLRDVAEHLSVSEGHLSRLFHKVTGKPVTSYIRESRVLIACNLLKNTRESIAEISGSLGFSSQSYFQKVFRETTGMTPNEFRRYGLL